MDLVRELKGLNARRKAGETLSPTEEARRKELKAYLRSTLEAQGGTSEDSAIKDAPSRSSSAPKAVSMPAATPLPVPATPPAPAVPVFDQAVPAPSVRSVPRAATPAPAPASFGPLDEDVPPPAKKTNPPLAGHAGVPGGRPSPAALEPLDEDLPPASSTPKPFVPRKDFFAIDAGNLLDEAASSEAVAKVDPFANRKAHASRAEVEEAEARADAALRATKKKDRPRNADEAVEQLRQTEAAYTPPEEDFVLEQYYGSFETEGYERVDVREAGDLKPIDPREIELAKLDVAGGPGGGATSVTLPPGLAFLDDFPVLYAKRIVPSPEEEVVVDSNDPNLLIPGKRKVTVHLLNGEKKQGAIRSLRRGELGFRLEPLGSGHPEEVSLAQVKAVFIHLQPNASPKDVPGRPLTAIFRDGRSVQGQSDDYQPGAPVFTLVPPAGRGQFERIIVNAAAVQAVQ